jgi:DNA-binding CsgD family transcriptional regulator
LASPFSDLSEGQKTCLRLVAKGMSSKEIAQQTGLAWQTVDTYLKQAISRTGATNRREAARALMGWELSQELGSPSPAVVETPDEGNQSTQADGRWQQWLRLPPVGGSTNNLSWSQKTLSAFQVAVVGAAVVIALALAVAGLLSTLR